MGLPGPDKGKGGNYLVLPPDYKGRVPKGYFTLRSRTYGVFVFWRAFFKDGVSHRPRRRRHPVAAGADGAMVRGSPVDQRVPGQRRLHGPFLVIERLQQQGAGK